MSDSAAPVAAFLPPYRLADFWEMPRDQSREILLDTVIAAHAWHFTHNLSYRRTLEARGIGPSITPADLPGLLRPTAQTFKSYIDFLGTPFPQDQPSLFLDWLADQLSVELPLQRFGQFHPRYRSLEALLLDFERIFADFGFEVLTSSGTSGRATILVRDQAAISLTVESFYLAFQRYLGMQADHRVIFIMPERTRIAMARMASFSFKRVGLPQEHIHFTIPFPAQPDQVRIRSGRTYREGWAGVLERRLWHPLMNWAGERYVNPQATRQTVQLLKGAQAAGEKVLLFSGLVQLHAVALELRTSHQKIRLAPGSLLGTGGGIKELYPYTADQIAADLGEVFELSDGRPIPLRDVYGMAEANWAAMQCSQGNYHIPPWVYVVVLNEDGHFGAGPEQSGLLAFFDPIGGGGLFPSFFRTADRVRLVNGGMAYDPARDCPCGECGAYLVKESIQRVDLIDEAGCAAQV